MLKLSTNTRAKRNRVNYSRSGKGSGIGRTIRNVFITIVVLLALFIGAALIYTWYIGQHAPVKTSSSAIKTTTRNVKKPHQPAPDAQIGVGLQLLSTPALPGSNASITIHTNAAAKCTISVMYNNVPSKDSGLLPKTADEYGMVTWTWTIEPTAPLGKWPVKTVCANAKYHVQLIEELEIVKVLPPEQPAVPGQKE